MKKAFSTFLVTSIVCSLMISASAFESKNISEVDTSNVIGYEYIISYSEEEIVGSINDAVFENSGSSSEMTSVNSNSSKELFSMTANNLGSDRLLVTNPPKAFYRSALSSGGLRITGTLTEATGQSISVKVGACWYNPSTGLFVADTDVYSYATTGTSVQINIPKSNFHAEQSYRGFVKHFKSGCEISGNLSFSNASM